LPKNQQGLPGLTNELSLAPSQWRDLTRAQEHCWEELHVIAHEAVAHELAIVYRSLGDRTSFPLDLLQPQKQPNSLLKGEAEELVKRAMMGSVKGSPA
jgi:hypothetical protein